MEEEEDRREGRRETHPPYPSAAPSFPFPHQSIEAELDLEFLRRMYGRIAYPALVEGAVALGFRDLPPQVRYYYYYSVATVARRTSPLSPPSPTTLRSAHPSHLTPRPPNQKPPADPAIVPADEAITKKDSFARAFHHALLELHLKEGALVCPETGRKFMVTKGVPNMKLLEDEV